MNLNEAWLDHYGKKNHKYNTWRLIFRRAT